MVKLAWFAILGVVGLGILLVGAVSIYHWSRFRGCEEAVESARATRATSAEAAGQWGSSAFETFTASQRTELRQSAERWHQKVEEITAKGRSSETTRVYLVGDMVYFVFFGADDRIRDFVCVGN